MLRAYDKATGEDVGAIEMPAPQSGSPMTYMLDGEQYIVLAISGDRYSGEFRRVQAPAVGPVGSQTHQRLDIQAHGTPRR